MKCPVCDQEFELSLKDFKDGFYYDCEYCHSNLFLKGETCEVLNAQPLDQVKEETSEEEVVEKQEVTQVPEIFVSDIEEEDQVVQEVAKTEEEEVVEKQEVTQVPEIFVSDIEEEDQVVQEVAKTSEEEVVEKQEVTQVPEIFVSDIEEEDQVVQEVAKTSEEEDQVVQEVAKTEEEEDQVVQEVAKTSEEKNEKNSLEDFSEVTEYGNQKGLGEEGVFYYNLVLSEINSEDVRNQVETILADDSLKLDPEKNNLLIEDGVLKISEISPVKVHVIVKSLIGLSLRISWEQHLVIDKFSK